MFGYRTPAKKTTTRRSPTKDTTNVRRSIDQWETSRTSTTPTDRTTAPPVQRTPPAGPSDTATLKLTVAGPTAPRRPSTEGAGASKTYTSRSAEATACLLSARASIKNSRNLKTEIREAVEKALNRLGQLVREAEADSRNKTSTATTKTKTTSKMTGTQTMTYATVTAETQTAARTELKTCSTETQTDAETETQNTSTCTTETQTDPTIEIRKKESLTIPTLPRLGENSFVRELQEHSKLIRSTQKQLEELQVAIATHHKTVTESEAPSYARVAATGCSSKTPEKRHTLHSVVVTSRDETETSEEVLEKVRKAVDAKEGWVKVERVRKAKNRKVVMGFNTTEDRDRATERLRQRATDLSVEDVKNRDPLLILRDVLLKNTDADIFKALRNQNREVFGGLNAEDDRLEIKYRRRARNPHNGHVVLSTSPLLWQRFTARGYAHVDLQRVRVDDQSPLVQCTRCLGFGHGRKYCIESQDACSHCGGPHLRTDCPEWVSGGQPTCVNCKTATLTDTEHNAFSSECPIRKKWDTIARSSVAYC